MTALQSWLEIPYDSDFSLANLPFGIISTQDDPNPRPAVAIGLYALDLKVFQQHDGFSALQNLPEIGSSLSSKTLNAFAALGRSVHRSVRSYLQDVLGSSTTFPEILRNNQQLRDKALVMRSQVRNHLPLDIGDYMDFFAGRNHAFNLGTPLRRPCGQIFLSPKAEPKVPSFMPCKRLDIELEMAMFISKGNELGSPISIDHAEEYIFGYALTNDWSARDVQTWEYVPLGPFNAKNFGTTISPWIVLADALEPFKTTGIPNDVALSPYLQAADEKGAFDIELEVDLTKLTTAAAAKGNTTTISRSNAGHLLWSWPQMIAHHTIGGCNLRTGDLFGSGTISGPDKGTEGSILEQVEGGKKPLQLNGGEQKLFLEDGDTVVIRGRAGRPGQYVGFGECAGQILPAVVQ